MSRFSSDAKLGEMSMEQEARAKREREGGSGGGGAIKDLLDWNNLTYTMPITNSVTVARNLKRFQSDYQTYTNGQTIVFTIQTGAQFVNWRDSYIKLNLSIDQKDDNAFWFGCGGSVMSLFRDIIVTSRGGTELQRIERFDIWRAFKDKYSRSEEWFRTTGAQVGYARQDLQGTNSINSDNHRLGHIHDQYSLHGGGPHSFDFIIPVSFLGGLFDSDQLMPSMMSSGLRIEIRLNKIENVVQGYTTADGQVSTAADTVIKAVQYKTEIVCDTHLLNDAATRQLNQTSAQNGLEFVYTGVFHQEETDGKTSNIQVSKAVSRALSSFAVKTQVGGDSNATIREASNIFSAPSKYQWRLGSQYYPFQTLENQDEMVQNILYAEDVSRSQPSIMRRHIKELYLGPVATFERSNLLRYSGVPINNSRTLSLDAEWANATDAPVHVFMEHVKLSKSFLNNIVVSI